ncbi:MAG TPA: hypothetical protein VMU77_08025, partial [Acidimicrobiales bacterium]|nr:hypothetical protein [Acidimicrobiales bacterium]
GLGVPYSSARTVLAEMVMSRNVAPPEKPISKGDSPERRLRIAKVVRELQQGLERNPEIREVVMALNMPGETKQVKYWVEAAILAGEIESYWD